MADGPYARRAASRRAGLGWGMEEIVTSRARAFGLACGVLTLPVLAAFVLLLLSSRDG